VTFEEFTQVVDHLAVLSLIDGTDAWGYAEFDIVIQACPLILASDFTVAGQEWEDTPEYIQGLVDSPSTGVRSVVSGPIGLRYLAGDSDFGKGITPMNLDIGISFVIFHPNVEMGAMTLDQVHFQDQGLEFGIDDDPFDIGDVAYQLARLLIGLVCMEIGSYPVAQIDGLTHIDDRTLGVFHQVATGFVG